MPSKTHEVSYLAGGCFWGMQDLIRRLPGVLQTRVGYTGGEVPHASYDNHGTHAEAVEVIFDPQVLPFRCLLEYFFQIHDPSTYNRQGNDVGSSYRSAIFFTIPEQQPIAAALIDRMNHSGLWPNLIVTEIAKAEAFWEAEPEHQNYLMRYPHGYSCHHLRPAWRLAAADWATVLNHAYHGNAPAKHRLLRNDAYWQEQLTHDQYHITRKKDTEPPFSSAYESFCSSFEPGIYACIGCKTPLFNANTQYDSHSGWPSFTESLPASVIGYHADKTHGMQRIEVTCNVCDAHLGHVFPDGPGPTGLRYCINSLALIKVEPQQD